MRKPIPFVLLVLLGIGTDLLTKWIAFRELSPVQIYVLVPNVLILEHAENHGVAFSLGAGHTNWILLGTGLAIGFIGWMYATTRRTASEVGIAAMALVLIGAIGNFVDRLFLGYVRDFIDFLPPIPIIGHWAVFNVADIAITIGVCLYAISEIFLTPHPEDKPPADSLR